MQNLLRTWFFVFVAIAALCAGCATSTANIPLRAASALAAPPSVAPSSKIWIGHYAAYEQFLRTAVIDRATPVGSARHVFFKPGGLASGGSLKAEAYKFEIAGYRLDRVLSLDMVPPTVEVRSNGEPVSLQLWVENVRLLSQIKGGTLSPPDPARWNAQLQRAYVFENLVANLDPNEGTPVVDPHWNLMILDHSRGFTHTLVQPYEIGKTLNQIDREFFSRVRALTKATVRRAIGDLVDADAIDALFARRDNLVKSFEALAARGENQVFTR
jgi:hypothetical protein